MNITYRILSTINAYSELNSILLPKNTVFTKVKLPYFTQNKHNLFTYMTQTHVLKPNSV